MKGSLRVALALVLAAAIGLPASGGCCDDFWGCAETVATAGLSCAAQVALAALRDLIRKIGDQRDSTTAAYNAQVKAALDDTNGQLASLDVDIRKFAAQIEADWAAGDKIYHEDADAIHGSLASARERASAQGLRLAPTPTPSASDRLRSVERTGSSTQPASQAQSSGVSRFSTLSVAALQSLDADPSLATLRKRLDDLKRRKEEIIAKIEKMQAQEAAQMLAVAQASRDAYASKFLKPIDDFLALLQQFLSHPLDFKGLGLSGETLFNDAFPIVEGLADQAEKQIVQVGDDALLTLHDPVEGLQKIAGDAQNILDTMKKMTALKKATERHTLAVNAVVPPAPTPSPLRKITLSATLTAKAKTLGAGLAALKPDVLQLAHPPAAVNVAPFRQQLAGQFDGFFRGKSPADAKKKRDELIAEARRRFASDPKTLAAVEKLLNDEARARGVPL